MIRTLSKASSTSKLDEQLNSLPITTGSKFRRTSKKQSIEETNFTSERPSSLFQHELSPPSTIRQPITRTNHREQRLDSHASSQISDPFINAKINRSKIKTETDEVPQRSNFIKKNNTNLNLGPTLSPEIQQKAFKTAMSPRANINQNTPQSSEIGPISSQIRPSLQLKRSSVLLLVIARLMRQKMAASLKLLLQNKRMCKVKLQSLALVLISAASGFYGNLQAKLKRDVLNRCKMMSAKLGKEALLIQNQMMKINNRRKADALPNFLHFLSRCKLKSAFDSLAKNKRLKKILSSCYPTLLDYYQRRKIRAAFEVFKRSLIVSQQRRSVLMGVVQSAYKFCQRLTLVQFFKCIKIYSYLRKNIGPNIPKLAQSIPLLKSNSSQMLSPRQTQSDSRKQRLRMQMERIGKETNEITYKIAQKRRVTDAENKNMKKRIEQLTQQCDHMKEVVNSKQKANSRLKEQVDSYPNIQILIGEAPSQSSLPFLQQIYSEISRASQMDFQTTLQRLLKDHRIAIPSHQNQQVRAWLLLGQKQALQSQIDAYQACIIGHASVGESKVNRAMRDQSEMVVRMIKNYIKQRYLWAEVQRFITKVL